MNKPNIKKNIIANYIGQFYIMFIGIFMLPFYLKYLGAEAYGLVGFFTMLNSWLLLLDMGLSQTLSRETAILSKKSNGLTELKQLLRSIEIVFFVVAFIIFSIIFTSSEILANNWLNIKELSPQEVINSIKIMGIIVVFRWFVGLYQAV